MAQSAISVAAPGKIGTFTALRQTNFRLYFIGQLISMSGTWMQAVAQGYLVFKLTQSEAWLGIVACAAGAPMLLIAPFAGVLVERMSRRRLLVITQIILMSLALILAALVFANTVQIWHIVVLALLLGVTNAFDAPARQTIISDLVSKELLVSGIAMNSIIVNGSRAFGPAIAGVFLENFGPGWCFLFNGLSFLAVIGMLAILRLEGTVTLKSADHPLEQLREGFRYARHNAVVRSILLLATSAGFFGWAIISLYPAFSSIVLHSPEEGYALIIAMNGLGAMIGGLIVGNLGRWFGRGLVICVGAIGTPLFVGLLSQTVTISAAATMSLMVGFFIIIYFVMLNMTLQITIAPEFRGRVMSLYTLCIIGFNPFGSLLLGWIAEKIGTPGALASYAALFALFCGGILVKSPALRKLK